jgi:hypothetical protein
MSDMKVLCLYNHPEYCKPLVRSASCFAAHGIDLRVVRMQDEAQSKAEMARPFDVLLLQAGDRKPHVIPDYLLECGKPTILLERVDGAQLRASRKYLPRVAGVIKSYVFRNRQQYNTEHDRAHVRMLHEAGIECERPLHRDRDPKRVDLTDADLAKLHLGYSAFGCHDIIQACVEREIDFDAPREIDVHFAGTVDYEGTEVDAHRRLAMDVAWKWQRMGVAVASPGRGVPRPQYYDQIARSKVVLCPWGWGEASYRDYEAMALGAVMVKPYSDHVEAWPDVYDEGETYVACAPDFRDAPDKIADIVEHWDDYLSMRVLARGIVAAAWQPETLAAKMASLIKEIVT